MSKQLSKTCFSWSVFLILDIPRAEERSKLNNTLSSWKLNNHSVNNPVFFQFVKFLLTTDPQQSEMPCLHAGDVTDVVQALPAT